MIDLTVFGIATLLCLLASSAAGRQIVVGDSKCSVTLDVCDGVLVEQAFRSNGQPITGLTGTGWLLHIDDKRLTPTNAEVVSADRSRVSFVGQDEAISWRLTYEAAGAGRITKSLAITAKHDILLRWVGLWDVRSDTEPAAARTELQDIAVFHRQRAVPAVSGPGQSGCPETAASAGLFASLDFPYSVITSRDGRAQISYPPYVRLRGGESYECHSLTFGATSLTGRLRCGFDDGEVDAMDAYIQERFRPRFDRPMFVSCCINNRYTQPDGRTIFYTMADHPTLTLNLGLLKREIDLMPQIGMEYYQVFPGVFDWVPGDPKRSDVRDIVNHARKRGVRIGDYSGTSSVFCTHYNEYGNELDEPGWRIRDEKGNTGAFCFGCPEFVDYYIDTVVPNCREYGFQMHCLDFLALSPCYAECHGHPAGPESLYPQVLGLTKLLQAINDVSPEMMTWSNSGDWEKLLPKLAWHNHNLYLTDPYIDKPWQGLNATRTMDDVRREQMVRLHNTRFLPYRFFTNCQYFLCQNSIVPDIRRNFEYGALSTIAVTPNLCLAEIRPWMDTLTAVQQEHVKAFYKKWTGFLKRNYKLWKKTYSAGEEPGPGAVEVYGHAEGSRGYVFIVNPNYWSRTVEIALDGSLGFDGKGRCEVSELYPVERLRLVSDGPFAEFGSRVPVHVPAQQVIVLEVKPAPRETGKPRLYGVPGTVEKTDSGYLVKTAGAQGATEHFAILLPKGSAPVISAEALADVPKQPRRAWEPTPARMIRSDENCALFEITFRRGLAPTELREWRVRPGSLADSESLSNGFSDGESLVFPLFVNVDGITPPVWDAAADALGLGPLANFCGGYVDNAFSEQQETWIKLRTGDTAPQVTGVPVSVEHASEPRAIPAAASSAEKTWWVQTTFSLPFMYGLGMEPGFNEHTILALPFIRRGNITRIAAWINGRPLEIRDYRYPRNRRFGCYWADLVGSGARHGENTLVIYFESAR